LAWNSEKRKIGIGGNINEHDNNKKSARVMSESIIQNFIGIEVPGVFSHRDTLLKSKSDRFIIAGYASYDVIDKEGDRVPLPVLAEAFERMMKIPERRNLNFYHTNIQIGRILPEWKSPSGKVFRSGVDDHGLFIVAELFDDVEQARKVRRQMKRGNYLAFSIGGQALKRKLICDDDVCWKEISKLDLHEITSCPRGVNQASKAVILRKDIESFKNVAKMAGKNDSFINVLAKEDSEEKIMSDENVDVSTEKSDLQVVLEKIDSGNTAMLEALNSIVEKLSPKEEDSEPKPEPLTKESIKALFDEWFAEKAKKKPEEEEEEEEEKKPEEPEKAQKKIGPRTDLERVMAHFGVSEAAARKLIAEVPLKELLPPRGSADKPDQYYYYKKPQKADFESDEEFQKALTAYNKFKEEFLEDLKADLGEVISKSPVPKTEVEPVNFDELYKKAEELDIDELLEEEGVVL